MKQFTITIQDKEGLHARPAGLLSKAAKGFQCAVTLTKGEKTADLKKIFAVMGLAVKGNTVAEIAKAMNVPAAELEVTLKAYAAGKAAGKDAFGRADMPQAMQTAPFFAVKVQPAVHHTMGGVKIDTKAEVLNPAGHTIPGLFAAGEVTGGVHGGNRLGGNAQADIVTFGRIAGQSADAYLKTAK